MARRKQITADQYDPYVVAGPTRDATLPSTLNTTMPPTDLSPVETPDCYGLNIEKDGRIAKGTIPSGTARVAKTLTISATTYYWHYNRAWRFSTTNLIFGAPNYNDVYYPQKFGKITLAEDANNILAIVPFGQNQMCIAKSTGCYILSNCADHDGRFERSDLIQELAVPAATKITELDGAIFVSNANGLFMYRDGETHELTRPVRDGLTNFASKVLTIDYSKKRIICGTTFVYDVAAKKIFRYSTTKFRFTSRQFHLPDYAPIAVDRFLFVIEHGDTGDGELKYQVKFEDGDWSDDYTVPLRYTDEKYTIVSETLDRQVNVRRFQLRLTDLSTTKYIKEIRLDSEAFNLDDYVR